MPNNSLMDKYLNELQLAYEAEKREDYTARKFHVNKATLIIYSMSA
jgi:flagellin-specific chaperone FliS